MKYFIIIVSLICIGVFVWAGAGHRKRNKKKGNEKARPLFHTEEDLETYGKSMTSHPVDFDDVE